VPLLALAVAAPVAAALSAAARARPPVEAASAAARLRFRALVFALHLVQPVARLAGRVGEGLTPWRQRGRRVSARRLALARRVWSEQWREPEWRLAFLESVLREDDRRVRRGGDFDRWDLELWTGLLGGARLLATTEEHGTGRQLTRFRAWARLSRPSLLVVLVLVALAGAAWTSGAAWVAVILAAAGGMVAWRTLWESAIAVAALDEAIGGLRSVEGATLVEERPGATASKRAA
jgi:hypothetical protein